MTPAGNYIKFKHFKKFYSLERGIWNYCRFKPAALNRNIPDNDKKRRGKTGMLSPA
jgi:hypothetical protein